MKRLRSLGIMFKDSRENMKELPLIIKAELKRESMIIFYDKSDWSPEDLEEVIFYLFDTGKFPEQILCKVDSNTIRRIENGEHTEGSRYSKIATLAFVLLGIDLTEILINRNV